MSGVVAIAAGANHTVALKSDGTVAAWGFNGYGQTTVPVGLSGVVAIAAGTSHTVALKSDGTVVAWGDNNYGQTSVPVGLSGVVAIAAGFAHTVALKSDGKSLAPSLKLEANQWNVSLIMKVVLGRKYQLQASKDLTVWTVASPTFVADAESLTQEFVVAEVGQFFRLVEVP